MSAATNKITWLANLQRERVDEREFRLWHQRYVQARHSCPTCGEEISAEAWGIHQEDVHHCWANVEVVELATLRIDGGTQSRAALNEAVIEEYVDALLDGSIFPPVDVYYDGTFSWLADGFHRAHAWHRLGYSFIPASIHQGTQRDAILHSVGANANHGLRRTNEDKRRAVMKLLTDEEWSQWSNREIARRANVSSRMVDKLRAELSANDSQMERKVERGGTVYTMQTGNIGVHQHSTRPADTPVQEQSDETGISPGAFAAGQRVKIDTRWVQLTGTVTHTDDRRVFIRDDKNGRVVPYLPDMVQVLNEEEAPALQEAAPEYVWGDGRPMTADEQAAYEAAQTVHTNGYRSWDARRKAAQQEAAEARRELAEANADLPDVSEWYELHTGDFREVLETFADQSVDHIITDPPYQQEAVALYGALARQAARVLRPGGNLIVMCGQAWLPNVLAEMTPFINYHWMLSYTITGNQATRLFQRRVMCFWKPILWFVNGKPDGDEWASDLIKANPENNDTSLHKWQQHIDGFMALVERFSGEGDVILDPMCGSGTTGEAALRLGRWFVGIDSDAASISICKGRLAKCIEDRSQRDATQ